MTTSTDTLVITSPTRRPSARVRFGIAFLIGVIAVLALGAGALYAYDRSYAGRILPGVKVGSIDLSGHTAVSARTALAAAYAGLGRGRIVLDGPDGELTIGYAEIGRGPDLDAMLGAALAAGRNGSFIEQMVGNARTALDGVTVEPRVTFDQARLDAAVDLIAKGLARTPVDATVSRTDKGYVATTSEDGRAVDAASLVDTIAGRLTALDAPSELALELPIATVLPRIDSREAGIAKAAAERMDDDIVLKVGKESWKIRGREIAPLVSFLPTVEGGIIPTVEIAGLTPLLKTLAKDVSRTASNASFRTSGARVTGVIAGTEGRSLDVDRTQAVVLQTILARRAGTAAPEPEPVIAIKQPALTTAEAEAALPKMKRISSWTTYFPITEKNGFGANIWIPAEDIDGYVVAPGQWFDFWKAVGPVTRARGYRDGGAIINGRTEPQGALAGGICSCSTTLFNAALRAGFQMGARRNHYYYIDRYPLGLDATVFKSGSGSVQTMSWRNDTDAPVLIRGFRIRDGSAGYVRFDLYSVPTGRKVSFSKPIVKNYRPAGDSVQRTSSLPAGSSKRIEYPVDGKDVWVTRTVRDRSGGIVHQETYYSHYARVTGIVLVGTRGADAAGQ